MSTKEIEQMKERLARLEEKIFGMDYETAEQIVGNYIKAIQENPDMPVTDSILQAERLLGV